MDLNQSDWKLQCDTNENSIIIDVRTDHEVAEGIIPNAINIDIYTCLLYTSPSPRDNLPSRMPSSA